MHLQRHSLKLAGIETWVSQICLPLSSSLCPLCLCVAISSPRQGLKIFLARPLNLPARFGLG